MRGLSFLTDLGSKHEKISRLCGSYPNMAATASNIPVNPVFCERYPSKEFPWNSYGDHSPVYTGFSYGI